MKTPRRDQLKSLLLGARPEDGDGPPQAPQAPAGLDAAPEQKADPRIRPLAEGRAISGSVRAMSRSLGELGAAAEEAVKLREQLDRAVAVIEIDPGLIDPSFVLDRLEGPDTAEGRAFLDDIRRHGQQVPILVRPAPGREGRYQIAYGHRRLWAARRLGLPVKAQVRALSDAELVIAQGQENAQRRDLSFIEKAMFARALDERGFDRATLMAALAVQTAEVTRLLAVARAVPAELITAIGPAPKAGRPRWLALAEAVGEAGALARALAAATGSAVADSDTRFARALAAATRQSAPDRREQAVLTDAGRPLVRLIGQGTRASLAFEDRAFAEYLASRLRPLYRDWRGLGDEPGS